MAQIKQLKAHINALQLNLNQRRKQLDEYKSIQTQADKKIKAIQKIHSQKIKSLLNSIQILKKQKAKIQGLSKQHNRSNLIKQLEKQIADQDIVIEVIRNQFYKAKQDKQIGRQILDKLIVDALSSGPERIRALTREQLKMEIVKLKQINLMFENKGKQNKGNKKKNTNGTGVNAQQQDDSISRVSSVMTQDSFIQNHQSSGQQVLQKLRSLQLQVETLNLQSNSKTKIIEKLKTKVNQSQKLHSDYQLLKNQLQISNRKLYTFEKLLKQNKQSTNKKLIDLYQRELKVQQLQMMSKQDSDKLKSLSANHNILLQQIQLQKQQLQTKYDELKQQNQRLIFENITKKKTFDQIKQINNKQKNQLGKQLQKYQQQATRILKQNQQLKQGNQALQTKLFDQRAQWIEDKQKFIQEIQQLKLNKLQSDKVDKLMIQIDQLRDQNMRLQKLFEEGNMTSTGDDKMLLQRLDNYKRKLEYYQSMVKNNPNFKILQAQGYNLMFDKYNKLLEEFQQYKRNAVIGNIQTKDGKTKKPTRRNVVQMTRKQKYDYENYSSGIDSLVLQDVDSQILDNFNTSYEFSIHVNEFGEQVKLPKISQADKQLLKLISSDLWYFVKDDKLTKKIDEASLLMDSQLMEDQKNHMISEQLRRIRNLSHPQGQKVTIYENQAHKLQQMSDNVSITSAMQKQLEQYDSDINIQMKKNGATFEKKKFLQESDVNSSIQSGQFKKKKIITQKASRIKIGTKGSIHSSDFESNMDFVDMLNSDVSSVNLGERQLNRIDSDVETDFRKKRK